MNEKPNLADLLGTVDNDGNPIGNTEDTVNPDTPKEPENPVPSKEDEPATPPGEVDSSPQNEPSSEEDPSPDAGDKGGDGESSVIKSLRQNVRDSKQELNRIKAEAEAERAFIEKLATQQGLTVEQFRKQLEDTELENDAKTKGMTPEALAAQRQLEKEVQELREENIRRDFITRAESLKQSRGLTDEQMEEFIIQARDSGINLLNPSIKFEDVYYALNRSSIEEQIREDERQKVLKDLDRQRERGATFTRKSGDGTDTKKGLEDLYADMAKLNL